MKIEINEDMFEDLVLAWLNDLHKYSAEAVSAASHPEDVEGWNKIRTHTKGLIEANWPYIKLGEEDA